HCAGEFHDRGRLAQSHHPGRLAHHRLRCRRRSVPPRSQPLSPSPPTPRLRSPDGPLTPAPVPVQTGPAPVQTRSEFGRTSEISVSLGTTGAPLVVSRCIIRRWVTRSPLRPEIRAHSSGFVVF